MSVPAWLLDAFAAVMLLVAAVSATRLTIAARAGRLGGLADPDADIDVSHLLMGIAMAGTLVAALTARGELVTGMDRAGLDVTDAAGLTAVVERHQITQIYLLAAALSANGEKHPQWAWNLNMVGLLNVLELARTHKLDKVFWPSSIAAFGPTTPADNTPQDTIMDPTTIYGISKLAGERWCAWYHKNHGVDVRSLRYPPKGDRFWGPFHAPFRWGVSMADYMATADDDMICMITIEHVEAVKRIDEIMAVPGIDVAVIGPGDLATSIGKRGRPDDPEVLALVAQAEAGILKSGVPIGGVARTPEIANQMIERGYVVLALGFDWSLFARGIAVSFEGIKR